MELLLAVVILGSVVATVSLIFPISTRNTLEGHQRILASNQATNALEEQKSHTYPYILLTPASSFSVINCNCAAEDLSLTSAFPVDPDGTHVASGTTFVRKTCVNYAASGTWVSHCGDPDTGYKYIRVRVSWLSGNTPLHIEQSTLVSR